MEILEHLPLSKEEGMVVENRGGGIPAIIEEIRKAGLQQPRFLNQIYQFRVLFPRGSLVAQETLAWLAEEARPELTVSQRLGAAMLHQGEELTNETYRTATGIDSVLATRELAGLVDCEMAEPEGERRGRKYRLHPKHRQHVAEAPTAENPQNGANHPQNEAQPPPNEGNAARRLTRAERIQQRRDRIVVLLAERPLITTDELAAEIGFSSNTVERDLTELRKDGRVASRPRGRRPKDAR